MPNAMLWNCIQEPQTPGEDGGGPVYARVVVLKNVLMVVSNIIAWRWEM